MQLKERDMKGSIIFILVLIFTQVLCFGMPDFRIINGRNVTLEDFPFMAQIASTKKYFCGGSIIHEYFVLTAAHCTYRFRLMRKIDPSVVQVIVGTDLKMSGGTEHIIEYVMIPDNYEPSLKGEHHDVSVIRLQQKIEFSSKVVKVPLTTTNPLPGEMGWVIGFGRTHTMRAYTSPHLMGVELPVVSLKDCRKVLEDVSDDMICAGFSSSSKDACTGDSGGPFIIHGKQVGIVSWGDGCGQVGIPGVYTSIAFYKSWIEKQMEKSLHQHPATLKSRK